MSRLTRSRYGGESSGLSWKGTLCKETHDAPLRVAPPLGEPVLEHLPAEAKRLDNKLHSLHSLDIAIHEAIAKENYDTSKQFARIAREHALAALEMTLECVALPSWPWRSAVTPPRAASTGPTSTRRA
jgi:hypothetical protein